MENRSHPSDQENSKRLTLYLDPMIKVDLGEEYDYAAFDFTTLEKSQFALLKKGERLWANFPDGEYCDLPYYQKNIRLLLRGFECHRSKYSNHAELFEHVIKGAHSLEKKLFSNTSTDENVKDLWDEIIKKVNSISAESHSLRGLISKILDIPFLQNFQTSLIVLHIKGQTKAEIIGTMWRGEKVQGLNEVKEFNTFFNSIKKSKIKSFHTDSFARLNLPFNGSFLAKDVVSKKYSLVAVVSRHDFLNYSKEEISLFETCIDLLQPHFERLIDQEFSDKRISELRVCLKDFPLPLRIKNSSTGTSFQNDLFRDELQDNDIFFNRKVQGPFSLDLYDSDELRHYAFDLFHFQRISLLGELLNTLRHELSNPLFGLKLSSQIFTTLDTSQDNKDLMKEIGKNVSRCQVIMENFSNLYQVQSEVKPISMKRIIEESLVLSKSEGREIRKSVVFQDGCEDLELSVPLIFVVQILFNLIVNSAQAMKAVVGPKEITLKVNRDDTHIHINVQDNGPGIPVERQTQLFKPFFTTKSQGTGLGLVLSRNLALKMGGNLEFLDHNDAKGAHFRLTLPLS